MYRGEPTSPAGTLIQILASSSGRVHFIVCAALFVVLCYSSPSKPIQSPPCCRPGAPGHLSPLSDSPVLPPGVPASLPLGGGPTLLPLKVSCCEGRPLSCDPSKGHPNNSSRVLLQSFGHVFSLINLEILKLTTFYLYTPV